MRRRVTVVVLCVCVCVCVYLSVCLSVTTPVPTSLVSMLRIMYVGVYPRLFSRFNSWIFVNLSVQKLWREKGNMQMSMYLPGPGFDNMGAPALQHIYILEKKECACERLLARFADRTWMRH